MSILLQITTAATDSLAAVAPAPEETLSLFDLALKGGPIMVPYLPQLQVLPLCWDSWVPLPG
ncbi:MAG: hypothetical protein IPL22_10295 [Bacteroidetes bacterium]|nr:hypothetical protein [Bacteroidota bacterium]